MMNFFRSLINLVLSIFGCKPKPEPDPVPEPEPEPELEPEPEPEPEPESEPEPEPNPDLITATRFLPDNYSDGSPLTISIEVVPAPEAIAWALEDAPPSGWTVSNLNKGGAWDKINSKMKWGLFFDTEPKTLTATLTPTGTSGIVRFSGLVSADGRSYAIKGDDSIN